MLRVRTRGSIAASLTVWQTRNFVSCANRTLLDPSYGPASILNVYVGDKTTTTDTLSPDYWKRKKRGEIILNEYSRSTMHFVSAGVTTAFHTSIADACTSPSLKSVYSMKGKYFIALYTSFVGIPGNPIQVAPWELKELQDEVWTETMANRQSGTANLVESFAELDKTFAMVRSPLINVHEFVRNFRKTAKRRKGYEKVNPNSKEFIRFASSEWLRFRYGITPLYNDVRAVMKALKKDYNSAKEKLVTTRASGSMNRTSQTNGTFDSSPYRVSYGVSRAVQITVRGTHIDKYKPDIFDELGLTFRNVVGVFWELTRYSFVVDWFANVGNVIYANIPRVSLRSYGGVLVTHEIRSSYFYPTGTTGIDPANWTVSGAFGDNYLMVHDTKDRNLRSDSDFALVIKSDFRFDHFTRAADAVALVNQVLHSIGF